MRIQHIENASIALKLIIDSGVDVVGVSFQDIVDKNQRELLCLVWVIIFSVEVGTKDEVLKWVSKLLHVQGVYNVGECCNTLCKPIANRKLAAEIVDKTLICAVSATVIYCLNSLSKKTDFLLQRAVRFGTQNPPVHYKSKLAKIANK
jgi:hypothetical protein